MIIDTADDRRLETIHIQGDRLFICVGGPHGGEETIILDKSEVEQLKSYLNMPTEGIYECD